MAPHHPTLYSLFLYLRSLWVSQPLGTVHIQEEILQQGLSFLQVPGILCLELKSLVLLVVAGILETGGTEEKAWLDHTDLTTLSLANTEALDPPHTKHRGALVPSPASCSSSLPPRGCVGQAGSLRGSCEAQGCAAVGEAALAVGSLRHRAGRIWAASGCSPRGWEALRGVCSSPASSQPPNPHQHAQSRHPTCCPRHRISRQSLSPPTTQPLPQLTCLSLA